MSADLPVTPLRIRLGYVGHLTPRWIIDAQSGEAGDAAGRQEEEAAALAAQLLWDFVNQFDIFWEDRDDGRNQLNIY